MSFASSYSDPELKKFRLGDAGPHDLDVVAVRYRLSELLRNPALLDRARERFNHSPLLYFSPLRFIDLLQADPTNVSPAGATTRSVSPNPRDEEKERRNERRWQLIRECQASDPYNLFSADVREERARVPKADSRQFWQEWEPPLSPHEIVKKRWIKQGIWNKKWDWNALGLWKHEEPLELESESETDTEAVSGRRPKSDDQRQQIAERRVVREREREASRPYHQFIYQISIERKRIQDESANEEGANNIDINTRAYENVKSTWIERNIWDLKWGILPGMAWKKEYLLKEEDADGPSSILPSPLANNSDEAGEAPVFTVDGAPLRYLSGQPVTNNFEGGVFKSRSFPTESARRGESSAINLSQQGPSTVIDSATLENGDTEHSPSGSIFHGLYSDKWRLHPTTEQSVQPSEKATHKNKPPTRTSRSPVRPTKVSKAARKKRPRPQQRQPSATLLTLPSSPPSSSGADAALLQPTPVSVNLRRSPRFLLPVPGVAEDSKHITRSKLKQNISPKIAGNTKARNPSKPRGISKRPGARTKRGQVEDRNG